jgi:hypothetical protein
MLGWFKRHWKTIAVVGVSLVVFVGVSVLTGGLGAPAMVAIALGGAASGGAGYALGQYLDEKPISAGGLVASVVLGAVLSVATAGVAGRVTPVVQSAIKPVVALLPLPESATAVVTRAATDKFVGSGIAVALGAGENAVAGRPIGANFEEHALIGGVTGAVMGPLQSFLTPCPAEPVVPERLGMAQILEGETGTVTPANETAAPPADTTVASPRGPPEPAAAAAAGAATSVHPEPPAWLNERFDSTVAAVENGQAVPGAAPEKVAPFLRETYEHVREVNALVDAMGGRARGIPDVAPDGDAPLRGVHDFGERVSVRRLEDFVAELEAQPLRGQDGQPIEVPAWLKQLAADARARGDTTVDVSKLSPYVASGLARPGRPDPYALELHRLSPHHTGRLLQGNNLIEAIADQVNAMRQVRFYKPSLPFDQIRTILQGKIVSGELPPDAAPLIDKALDAENALEHSGKVNPYYLGEKNP